jgi:IS605 OrfB family transposase
LDHFKVKITLKRQNKINDFMHKASHNILDYCVKNHIDTVVIGNNKNNKQNSNMGKRNNQNFVSIPFALFIKKLKYKLEEQGIKLIETEESYTSKSSFIDNDELPKYKKRNLKNCFCTHRNNSHIGKLSNCQSTSMNIYNKEQVKEITIRSELDRDEKDKAEIALENLNDKLDRENITKCELFEKRFATSELLKGHTEVNQEIKQSSPSSSSEERQLK